MSRFRNIQTEVVVGVSDDKDHRFASSLWEPLGEEKKAPAKRASSSSKSDK